MSVTSNAKVSKIDFEDKADGTKVTFKPYQFDVCTFDHLNLTNTKWGIMTDIHPRRCCVGPQFQMSQQPESSKDWVLYNNETSIIGWFVNSAANPASCIAKAYGSMGAYFNDTKKRIFDVAIGYFEADKMVGELYFQDDDGVETGFHIE